MKMPQKNYFETPSVTTDENRKLNLLNCHFDRDDRSRQKQIIDISFADHHDGCHIFGIVLKEAIKNKAELKDKIKVSIVGNSIVCHFT